MKIKFIPASKKIEEIAVPPESAKNFIPEWYKKIAPDKQYPNLKACMPFLDALNQGYIQKTWVDICIEESADGITVKTEDGVGIVSFREPNNLPEMTGYYNFQFLWNSVWSPIFPENFSGLITHPLNRIDLPFYTFAGVIEFDKFRHVPVGNLPFYLKKGFTGIIPKGTPMYQIIPLMRADWEASIEKYAEDFWPEKVSERASIEHWYKKKIWNKKEFKVNS